MVGALILIFLHPDLPKIFGHYFKNFYVVSTTYSTVEHYSDFFKHENSELQFRKRTKEKMVRFFVCM